MKEIPDEMIDYCPFCGRKHRGNYVLCTECGALMCDSCDAVERRDMNDGEPLCPDCVPKGANGINTEGVG